MGHSLSLESFSIAELGALRLNGELSPTYELWEEPDGWQRRAKNVLNKELHPLVLTGMSAVWAFGLCPEPAHHSASTITINRIRLPKNDALKIEQRNLSPADMWTFDRVGVTSPLRTVTDLLRSPDFADTDILKAVTSLLMNLDITKETVRSTLEKMTFYPYIRLALQRVELLLN